MMARFKTKIRNLSIMHSYVKTDHSDRNDEEVFYVEQQDTFRNLNAEN